MARRVAIACFRERLDPEDHTTTVAVDVLRATTTAITAVTRGRRCYPVPSVAAALARAADLDDPLLAGELEGVMPVGFHVQNSPAALHRRDDVHRPLVLLSTSGTPLMREAGRTPAGFAACLRNVTAQAADLSDRPDDVRLLGADSRGEFRDEDQLCCARIAARLLATGFEPRDQATEAVIERWSGAPDGAVCGGRSARYLMATGQREDLEFTLAHIDDLQAVFPVVDGELQMRPVS